MSSFDRDTLSLGPDLEMKDSEESRLVHSAGLDSSEELDLNEMANALNNDHEAAVRKEKRRHRVGAVGLLGGFILGYDFGVISAALLQLMTEFHLTCLTKQLLVSGALFGAFGGSLFGGHMLDLIGRRATLLINAFVYMVGTGLVVCAPALWMLVWGRITTGLALAIASSGECVYISEMIDPDNRGKLISLREMGVPMGYLFSNVVGFMLIQTSFGWRIMFAIPLIALLIQFTILFYLNESERYIVSVGKPQESSSIKKKIQANDGNIIGRGMLGFGLVIFQQLTGQVNILYYTPYVLHAIGVRSIRVDVLISASVGVVKAISTMCALLSVDSVGRRKLLTLGPVVMVGGAVVMSSALMVDPTPKTHDDFRCFENDGHEIVFHFNETTATDIIPPAAMQSAITYLFGAAIYIGAFSVSFAPVVWVVLGEIYPTNFRGRAISAASAINWLTNWVISFTFLYALDSMGAPTVFGLYGLICVIAAVFVYFFLPETRGKTLEEINENFTLGPEHGGYWCCFFLPVHIEETIKDDDTYISKSIS